jgi:hypothetical protein
MGENEIKRSKRRERGRRSCPPFLLLYFFLFVEKQTKKNNQLHHPFRPAVAAGGYEPGEALPPLAQPPLPPLRLRADAAK